ncbi:MAG: ferritin-like domain-containing protein [Clostridia bacterium]|nr:ferritin-like domain-containing protein [Clostridia bacterium]
MNAKELVDGLNQDLAHEYAAIIQYLFQAAAVKGLDRPRLRDFFLTEIQDELGHAQFLADKIVALGGTPTVTPAAISQVTDPKGMIEADLAAERDTIRRYAQRAMQAEQFGDIALKVQLENFIADETRHAEELQKLLA